MQKQKGNVKKSIILIEKEVKDGIIGNKKSTKENRKSYKQHKRCKQNSIYYRKKYSHN